MIRAIFNQRDEILGFVADLHLKDPFTERSKPHGGMGVFMDINAHEQSSRTINCWHIV